MSENNQPVSTSQKHSALSNIKEYLKNQQNIKKNTYYNLGNLSINEVYINLLKKYANDYNIELIGYNLIQYNDNNIDNYSKINNIINLNISSLPKELRKYKIEDDTFNYNYNDYDTLKTCPSISISLLFKYHVCKQLIKNKILNYNDVDICNKFINYVDNIINNSPFNLSIEYFENLKSKKILYHDDIISTHIKQIINLANNKSSYSNNNYFIS